MSNQDDEQTVDYKIEDDARFSNSSKAPRETLTPGEKRKTRRLRAVIITLALAGSFSFIAFIVQACFQKYNVDTAFISPWVGFSTNIIGLCLGAIIGSSLE
jgi:hypothetical protein